MAAKPIVPGVFAARAPIQTIPQGLLGMLQLKQTGQNPGDLVPTVQPGLDLFALYAQRLSNELVLSGIDTISLATASPGGQPFATTVPNGQAWWVERFTIGGTLLAAETISLSCAVRYIGSLGVYHIVSTNPPAFVDVITARARAFRITAGGFWLPGPAQFAAFINDDLTGATITLGLGVRGFAVPI